MDISGFFYTPQDIAKFIFEMDLGAKSQEPFISAVWLKEQSFINPQWRKGTYKDFYQAVSRFLDGCIDVADKKKDLAYLSDIHRDNSKINFSEDDYINDFSKLKFSYFKELRLKMLFFGNKVNYLYRFSVLAEHTNYDLEPLHKCFDFYRITYLLTGNKYYTSIKKVKNDDIVHISITDGIGIYDGFMNLPKAEYQEEVEEEEDEDEEVAFDTEMYITAVDLQDFFKTMQIKQKGTNNQLQFIHYLAIYYFDYLDVSDSYLAALKLYEESKRYAEFKWNKRKFALLKHIKLYLLRTGRYYQCTVEKLVDDIGNDSTLSQLKKYLNYYGLVVVVDNAVADIEELALEQVVDIRDVSFLDEED